MHRRQFRMAAGALAIGGAICAALAGALADPLFAQSSASAVSSSGGKAPATQPAPQGAQFQQQLQAIQQKLDADIKARDQEIDLLKQQLKEAKTQANQQPPATLPAIAPLPPLAAEPVALPAPATQPAALSAPATQPAVAATRPSLMTMPVASATQPTRLSNAIATEYFNLDRDKIAPSLGATTYTLGPSQIKDIPQGQDAPFQQVLLRAPGVVMDSFGQEHVRGEHGNLTYDVNGVLLPEGLNGFAQELDTRLIQSVTLIDGSLPAQYGFHTAGIIDVTTKTGANLQGGELSLYGGSFDTFEPSLELGGTYGKWDYFVTASYRHDSLGIENPAPTLRPIHDDTDQSKFFGYFSYHIDDTSRLSILLNAANSDFQIPDLSGEPQLYTLSGHPFADSATLTERQNEQDYYGVVSYQKVDENLSLQASVFSRYGQIHYTPDVDGDLIFQGIAAEELNSFFTNGFQYDMSYILNDQHTLRAGLLADYTQERLDTHTTVFPANAAGNQTSDAPEEITDNSGNRALTAGVYLQDEWKLTKSLTLNYGGRYDRFDANFDDEGQFSPRVNLVWKIDKLTTAHVGYARYFVTPPLQYIQPSTLAKFVNTTGAAPNLIDHAPRVERSNYYDLGVSRQIAKPWVVNLDGFYKEAHNLIDLGQFGDAVILSPYNYRVGYVYGAELSTTYSENGFSTFGNVAWVDTSAKDINSDQFEFADDELAYIDSHYIKLDHESQITASTGISYAWKHDRAYIDVLYGSGLRSGFANLGKEPQYLPVNAGYSHDLIMDGGRNKVTFRFDIINLFDQVYQIRSGTGLGVNAPQYGQRRTFLVGLTYHF